LFDYSFWCGKRAVLPGKFSLGHFPLPCSDRVRVISGVSSVRVRVGSVGLGLVGLVLALELELGLGLWFGLGRMFWGNVRHSLMSLRIYDLSVLSALEAEDTSSLTHLNIGSSVRVGYHFALTTLQTYD